jgi:predicted TIM-barrel fold metal-dependent hydrolase
MRARIATGVLIAIRQASGSRARHEMGVDKVMWASDFPHLESDWPNSRRVIEENFAGVPENDKWKMIVGNALKYFRLDQPQAGKNAEHAKGIQADH